MNETAELISTVGFPAAIVIVLVFALFRVGRWAAPLGSRIVSEHVIFLDATKQQARRTADTLEKQTELLSNLQRTNKGLIHLADAAENALADNPDAARQELAKMRKQLET